MASVEHPKGRIRTAAVELQIEGYEDARVIGRGGFAVVYRARQRAFNRTVAVKVLSAADLDTAALRRFERERVAIGTLSGHPNIVTVYDSGLTAAGVPFLAMEHLSRGSLADLLRREGPVRWQQVVPWGVRLAGALESAHRFGVLHRDIKPENVLLSNFGEPKLADFGIASVVGGPETRSSQLALSILHAPPEVVDGQSAKEASDVYSLGSTLITLLLGQPPFFDAGDESLARLLARIVDTPVPDLTTAGAPRSLQGVLETAMAKDPAERYPSALAMGRALQGVEIGMGRPRTALPLEDDAADEQTGPLGGMTARMSRTTPAPRSQAAVSPAPPRRRDWRVVAGVSIAVIVVAAATAVGLALRHHSPAHAGSPGGTVNSTPATTVVAPLTVGGALPPGTYRTAAFRPTLTFHVDDGWSLNRGDATNIVELARSDTPGAVLGFHMVDEMIDPSAAPTNGDQVDPTVRPLPADVGAWLAGHPRLRVRSSAPSSVGGPGTAVDFTVGNGYTYGNADADNPCTHKQCVMLFRTLQRPYPDLVGAVAGDAERFYVVSEGNRVLLIAVSAPAAGFANFAAEAQMVLNTLSVGSS